jgi:hypothetical protein
MKQIVAALAVVFSAASVHAQSPGQTMHDTYCVICHDSGVYTREDRIARNYDDLRAQVARWQENVSLNWSETEIDLVASWLAGRYYGLKCPDDC